MKLNCILIDDEPLALEALEALIDKIPGLEIMGKFTDPVAAFEYLNKTKVDLMFLDIQMPELTGFKLIEALIDPPMVIITTAYRNYAPEAFDLDVIDYLLKPVSLERLMRSINRYYERIKDTNREVKTIIEPVQQEYIMVYADKKNHKVLFSDILYIRGLKDYIMIYTSTGKIIAKNTMKDFLEKLPCESFSRSHRSYIVSLDKITSFSGNSVYIGNIEIPVGRNYKNEILKKIENN